MKTATFEMERCPDCPYYNLQPGSSAAMCLRTLRRVPSAIMDFTSRQESNPCNIPDWCPLSETEAVDTP